MKQKRILWFSIGILLLIGVVQWLGMTYAYNSLREKLEVSLNQSFKKAFGRVVDDQINNLPYPDGTATHLLYYPIDSTHVYEMEDYAFHITQQSSAVLQDYYDQPEVSLDSLRQRLEKELEADGVGGHVAVQKVNVTTGQILQEVPAADDRGWTVLGVTSCRAWLHEARSIAVQARLEVPFPEGQVGAWALFCLLTLLLSAFVIGALYASARRLQVQNASLEDQRQDFYRQAKEMEQPVERMGTAIGTAAWQELAGTGRQLLSAVEGALTRAKQAHARLKKQRVWSLPGLSALGLTGVLVLVCLWGGYWYRNYWQKMAHLAQICIEEALIYENSARSNLSARASGKRSFAEYCLNGTWTKQLEEQVDDLMPVFWEEKTDSAGKKQYVSRFQHVITTYAFVRHGGWNADENARLYSAYGMQQLMEEYAEVFVPVDSVRMDSLFRAQLQRRALPAGRLHFYRAGGDSLSSGWTEVATHPLRIREDRSEWMQGVVPVSFRALVRGEWYLFVPLVLMLVFTLCCFCLQWGIARRLRKLGQFRRDFTYAMIHDMKSPLQSLLMGSQILASGKLPVGSEKAVRIVSAMQDECEHLLALSHRVVTLTQIERGELQLHKTEVSLRPLLDDLVDKFRLKGVKPMTFDVDCAADCCVTADAFCLREVLSNLIDNAVKYSRESVHICLSAGRSDGNLCIRVRDNGIGISPRDSQRIFDKFERVASSRLNAGFGLGLSFVRQVVQAHGGSVSVQSDGRSYSEFAVMLPGGGLGNQ